MIPCPDCGNLPRPGETECRECGSLIPEPKRASDEPLPIGDERQFDVDRREGSRASSIAARPRFVPASAEHGSPTSLLVAIVTDDESTTRRNSVEGRGTREGGPTFAGTQPTTTPVGPPGVRTLTANNALGTIASAESAATMRKRQRTRRRVIGLVLFAVLVTGGYLAYPRVRLLIAAHSVPTDLRSYVEGKGVVYAAAGQGYSVRLPKRPVVRDAALTPSRGNEATSMHRSIASSGDYQIVIRVGDVPSGTVYPFGVVSALADPVVAGRAEPTDVRRVDFAGQAAYDYDLRGTPPRRGRIFRRGARLYVITVQSKSVDTVFDALMKSFHFSR